MYLVETRPSRDGDLPDCAITADPSARFIFDLATSFPPLGLASMRAASDVVERACEARWREVPAIRQLGVERRLRIVTKESVAF